MQAQKLILKLGGFTGPFDVLLEEIHERKMDIMNLNLMLLTDQYLRHIKENFTNLDIEQISDYLVMASYLVELKSKRLLAMTQDEPVPEEQESEEKLFIRYLLEYKRYQEILPTLEKLTKVRNKIYSKPEDDAALFGNDEVPNNLPDKLSPKKLLVALERIKNRALGNENIIQKILVEEIPVEDVENYLYNLLETQDTNQKEYGFFELLKSTNLPQITLMYFVTAFLAILNLGRNQKIKLSQESIETEIFLRLCTANEFTIPQETEEQILARQQQFEKDVKEYAEKIKKERYEKYLKRRNEYIKEKQTKNGAENEINGIIEKE